MLKTCKNLFTKMWELFGNCTKVFDSFQERLFETFLTSFNLVSNTALFNTFLYFCEKTFFCKLRSHKTKNTLKKLTLSLRILHFLKKGQNRCKLLNSHLLFVFYYVLIYACLFCGRVLINRPTSFQSGVV
jgi:hypothetical protein